VSERPVTVRLTGSVRPALDALRAAAEALPIIEHHPSCPRRHDAEAECVGCGS